MTNNTIDDDQTFGEDPFDERDYEALDLVRWPLSRRV
jgi:hypothetical protein